MLGPVNFLQIYGSDNLSFCQLLSFIVNLAKIFLTLAQVHMDVTPEIQILILNSVIVLIAYFGIYPSLDDKTLDRIMSIDVVLSAIALTVTGALFWGTGTKFELLFFHTNWIVFTVATMLLMEIPLFLRFVRRHNIDLFEGMVP